MENHTVAKQAQKCSILAGAQDCELRADDSLGEAGVLLTLIGWNDSIVARSGKGLSGMREKVEAALGKIRPSLQADGGDVELVDVTADGIVKVKLKGACAGCPMSTMTLKNGIERILKQEIAEVKSVQAV